MIEELVVFLQARLAEEHALAARIKDRFTTRGEYADSPGTPFWPTPRVAKAMRDHGDPDVDAQGDLIEMFDPTRVLVEVDAKRRIVAHAAKWAATLHQTPEGWTLEGATAYRMAMEWTLRAMALPYAGHPDYRQEWAPAA